MSNIIICETIQHELMNRASGLSSPNPWLYWLSWFQFKICIIVFLTLDIYNQSAAANDFEIIGTKEWNISINQSRITER